MILLMIIVVRGCCIFVLVFMLSVMGMKLRFVINVVISIGCKWVIVLLIIEFINLLVFFIFCLIKDSIIRLFNIVILESVIKLIFVDIERGIFLI